ncbi:hypothetical protein AB0K16_13545 [Nonomuraea jabiensis]|uniref:Uncharacterized protein n=1 Tax=Nonomuraea jabiensis TaxID=882448 RepID=A0A7W9LID3_9ACTN|nr:hypothetical protein [Nonomuraea jabiensis]MBB5784917.1 hypothetical protein [Nonomuraea jabiensis]
MDIEAEIRALKLRIDAFEAILRSSYADSDDNSHAHLRTGRRRTRAKGSKITAAEIAVAEMRAEIADAQMEIAQDFAALGDELTGLRRQTNDQFISARAEILGVFDSLRHDMVDLGRRIDRLLTARNV